MRRATWEPVTDLSPAQLVARKRFLTGIALAAFIFILGVIVLIGVVLS